MKNEVYSFFIRSSSFAGRLVYVSIANRPKEDNEIDHKLVLKCQLNQTSLRNSKIFLASVAEWSIALDCKSNGISLRGFESLPAHNNQTFRS